jgi:hypothetical protein
MYLSTGLCVSGIFLAGSVEWFARRFINTVHLQNDGKSIRITFHTAYTRNIREKMIKISDLQAGEELTQDNIKLKIKGHGIAYFNLHRNELKDDDVAFQVFAKIV